MTRWHHGASTLLRHVVAALPFRGGHCRTRKNTRHGWRDRPQQGDRQQRECSGSSHPHKCTTFSGCDEQVLASKNDVSLTRTTAAVTGITASKLSFKRPNSRRETRCLALEAASIRRPTKQPTNSKTASSTALP